MGAAKRMQREGLQRRALALCCAVLALGGASARRSLHQSDESGETGDAATSSELTIKPPPPPFRPPVPGFPAHAEIAGTTLNVRMLNNYPDAICNDGAWGMWDGRKRRSRAQATLLVFVRLCPLTA